MELTTQMPGTSAVPLDDRSGQGSSSPPTPHVSEDAGGGDGSSGGWSGFEPVIWECSGITPDADNQERGVEFTDYGATLRGVLPLPLAPWNMSLPDRPCLTDNPVEGILAQATWTLTRNPVRVGSGSDSQAEPGRLEPLPSPLAILSRQSPQDFSEVPGQERALERQRWFRSRSGVEHPMISQREITSRHFKQCRAQRPSANL